MLYEIEAEYTYNQLIYKGKAIPTIGDVKVIENKQMVIREIVNIKSTESTIKIDYIAEDLVGKERFRIIKERR